MKKNAKLALICFSMCSLFAFTEAKAQVEKVAVQEVITDTFYVEDLLEVVEEPAVEEVVVEEKESFDDFWEIYYSYSTMDFNYDLIANDLGATTPQHGIGIGMRAILPLGTDYFTMNYNFGYTFGIRQYSDDYLEGTRSRTLSHTGFVDLGFGGQVFFTKNHKNGIGLSAGFGYDYSELHLSKAPQGYAMVLDSKVIQHAFYVPVGLRLFFGDFSLSGILRFPAFDIDMTIESRNPENISPIKDGRTLYMLPLEISLGFKF
jgi:hypothetical protein